jgi:ribosomal subunit interface protein
MNIQVNGDHSIVADTGMKHFVEHEVSRLLDRFAVRLTRVEVHLTDVDNKKTGKRDKRCLVEARPAGAHPLTVSAKAVNTPYAIDEALRKMRSRLAAFLERRKSPGEPALRGN